MCVCLHLKIKIKINNPPNLEKKKERKSTQPLVLVEDSLLCHISAALESHCRHMKNTKGKTRASLYSENTSEMI